METAAIGGVTALALDAANRLLYVGTDTDGVYRLRDVSVGGRDELIASGHLLLEEPVEEIAVDSTGAGLAFVRTQENLYRAEALGLRWVAVESLPGPPTAVAVADTRPPTVYAGAAGAGVVVSRDGVSWRSSGQGMGSADESRLLVYDLVVDAAQPGVIYAGAAIADSGDPQRVSSRVAMSVDGGERWSILAELDAVQVAELLPAPGRTGEVYALTTASRTPLAVGETGSMGLPEREETGAAGQSAAMPLAWILAGHASAALLILTVGEIKGRIRRTPRRAESTPFEMGTAPFGS